MSKKKVLELDIDMDPQLEENDSYDEDSLLQEDLEADPKANQKLIKSVRKILQIKKRGTIRREAVKNAEEFVAVKKRSGATPTLNKLLKSAKESGEEKAVDNVTKLVKAPSNKPLKTLETPLEKPQALKAKRTVLYDNAKKDVSRWNAIVYHNRLADQLVYPLNAGKKLPKRNTKDLVTDFIPMTPLEEEMAKILYGDEYVKKKKSELEKPSTPTDSEAYMLSVEEALTVHSEMARLRALQSYEMIKAKRQKKIKSKKYHRLLRKEKIKKQLKEFEELQHKDPEGAMEKLDELNKSRIQERMSLKHRNTSKWSKMQKARAKYNNDSRVALSEQLIISRDLRQKVQESSDDDDDLDLDLPNLVKSSLDNPWMLKPEVKDNEKMQLYYSGYKKLWEKINAKKEKEMKEQELLENNNTPEEEDTQEQAQNKMRSEALQELKQIKREEKLKKRVSDRAKKKKEAIRNRQKKSSKMKEGDADEVRDLIINPEEQNIELTNGSPSSTVIDLTAIRNQKLNYGQDIPDNKSKTKSIDLIDPNNYLKISRKKSNKQAKFDGEILDQIDFAGAEDDVEDDGDDDQRMLIAEAFEDDNVIEDFRKRKADEIESSKPKDIDLHLPGWGEWGGKGIIQNIKRRKRFIVKAPSAPPRKDSRMSHVILNEEASEKMKDHQVRELPFPFKRVKDFEKTIRAPVGRTWLPEKSMKEMTAPKIITRLGSIIQPIDEDILAETQESNSKEFKVPISIKRLAKVRK